MLQQARAHTETLKRAAPFEMTHGFDFELRVKNSNKTCARSFWKWGKILRLLNNQSVRVCVVFFIFFKFIWANQKDVIAVDCHIKVIILGCDLENCFGHIVQPWQEM